MPAPLTQRQVDLARHALGLPNQNRQSYRNRFVAGPDHDDYDDWYAMTCEGWAVRHPGAKLPFGGDDLFKLTLAGARAVLVAGETLDPEDFPTHDETRKDLELQYCRIVDHATPVAVPDDF